MLYTIKVVFGEIVMESDIKIEESIEPTINILVDYNINYGDYPNLTKEFINHLALEAENYIRENVLRYMLYDCGIALKRSLTIMNNILFAQMDEQCKHAISVLDSNLRQIGMQIDDSQLQMGNVNIVKATRQYCEYGPISLGLLRQ